MFDVSLTASARQDLRYLKKADQVRALDAIEQQLVHEPLTETRNRQPLRPNDLATWKMRIGQCRVFYDVEEADGTVTVKAIGWKEHNKLYIRGKEYSL